MQSSTYDLVTELMRDYFGKAYHLYMDNYYSSPKLYVDLFDLEVGAAGTLRDWSDESLKYHHNTEITQFLGYLIQISDKCTIDLSFLCYSDTICVYINIYS